MFNSQHLPVYAVSLHPRNLRQTEALRTMPSTVTCSATFEELALPLFASLYNHAFWLTRNQSEAEDLVQETFSKALRAFDSFEPDTNFKAWIFRILRNTFLTSRSGIAASRTVFLKTIRKHSTQLPASLRKTRSSVSTIRPLSTWRSNSFSHNSARLSFSATWKKLNTKTLPPS
jgi:RNA polymerase sigma factor (sigma-70 family)